MKKHLLSIFFISELLFAGTNNYVTSYCIGKLNTKINDTVTKKKYLCIENKLYLLHIEGYGKYKTGFSIPLNKSCKCYTKNIKSIFGVSKIVYIKTK